MKALSSLRHWYRGAFVLLVLVGMVLGTVPVFAQATGEVTSTVTVSDPPFGVGDNIDVTIIIDMSAVDAPDNVLGGYTGTLNWDPAILGYVSYSGAPPTGFTGVVNVDDVATGLIAFNGANASGATGETVIIVITFNLLADGYTALDLEYSAMASAETFEDLLPILTVTDGSVEVPTAITLANYSAGSTTPVYGAVLAGVILVAGVAGFMIFKRNGKRH